MTRWIVLWGSWLSVVLGGCNDSTGPGPSAAEGLSAGSTELDAGGIGTTEWHTVFDALDSLVLAGWAVSDDDAFFVGSEGQVLRHRDSQWWQFEVPTESTLWWVWGTSGENVYVGGEEGTLLHFDGSAWTKIDAGLDATQTIWGIWGASDSDIWVVGGNARSNGPGFVLRGDRDQLVELSFAEALPNVFKVWGPSRDEVYLVGDRGLVIQYEESEPQISYLDPHGSDDDHDDDEDGSGRVESLFTVAGNSAGDIVAVGGVGSGMLFEKRGTEWVFRDLQTLGLNGAAVTETGQAYAVGLDGTIRHRVGDDWLDEDHASDRHYHSAVLMGDVTFAVGGDLLSARGERKGLIVAKGDIVGGDIVWIPTTDAGVSQARPDAGSVRDAGPDSGPKLGTSLEPTLYDAGRRSDAGHPTQPDFDSGISAGNPAGPCAAAFACNAPAECWYIQGEEYDSCVTPCSSAAECGSDYGPDPQCAVPGCQTLVTVCMPAGWRGCF